MKYVFISLLSLITLVATAQTSSLDRSMAELEKRISSGNGRVYFSHVEAKVRLLEDHGSNVNTKSYWLRIDSLKSVHFEREDQRMALIDQQNLSFDSTMKAEKARTIAENSFRKVEVSSVIENDSINRRRAAVIYGGHRFSTLFYGEEYYYAAMMATGYATNIMNFGLESVHKTSENVVVYRCVPGVSDQVSNEYNLTFTFYLNPETALIDRCVISGYSDYVLQFYIGYWTDSIRTENKSDDELVYSFNMGDRISYVNKTSGEVKVIITKDTRYN